MGFLDKLLQKISTKDPEKVARGDTVFDGWYTQGHENIIGGKQKDKQKTKNADSKDAENLEK